MFEVTRIEAFFTPFTNYLTSYFRGLVSEFGSYLYSGSNAPAYVCLLRDIAEEYGIELLFIVFMVSLLTLLALTITLYENLRVRVMDSLRRSAEGTSNTKVSKIARFIYPIVTYKFFG